MENPIKHEIDKLTTPIIKGERPIYYLITADKLNNLKRESIIGDILFALFSIMIGLSISEKAWGYFIVGFILLLLSLFFYWNKFVMIRNTKESGEVESLEFQSEKIDEKKLTIIKAEYGTHPDKIVDVTEKLKEKISADTLSFIVSNELVDKDPDPGIVKKLRVEYSLGRNKITKTFIEHNQLQIP